MITLENYLKTLYDLEINKYITQKVIEIENSKINDINKKIGEIAKGKRERTEKLPYPQRMEEPNKIDTFIGMLIYLGIKCFVIWFISGLACVIIAAVFKSWEPGLRVFIDFVLPVSLMVTTIIFSCAECVSVSNQYNDYIEEKRKVDITNKRNQEKYEEKCEKINEQIRELRKQEDIVKNNIEFAKNELINTENILEAFYSLDILFFKYRNLEAISKILEYFQSKRCTTLPEAYNKFEEEKRIDIIIDKFDLVLEKLDEIKKYNVLLYTAMKNINSSLEEIYCFEEEQKHSLEQLTKSAQNYNEKIIDMKKDVNAIKKWTRIRNENDRLMSGHSEYRNLSK